MLLIYKAIIENGIEKPYSLLFRNLKRSEDTLQKEGECLSFALEQVNRQVAASHMLPFQEDSRRQGRLEGILWKAFVLQQD